MMPMDDGAMNAAALEEALGAPPPLGDPAMAGAPDECPLCTGPVDPETGMTLVPPAMPEPPASPGPLPPGMV